MKLRFEPLAQHDRSRFTSGNAVLDDWFVHRAGQDQRRNVARVVVALDSDVEEILGYYSLSAFSVGPADFPADLARKLPRYDVVPAALIGRLARHSRVRGEGLGAQLVADAVKRLIMASDAIAIHAIIVDAIDDHAARFYESLGFLTFPEERSRLYLPIATARKAMT